MASRSVMDAERGGGGRYLELFVSGNFSPYFPLVAENLPLLTGAIVISTTTVSNNPQPTNLKPRRSLSSWRVISALLNTFTASENAFLQDDCEEGKSNKKCLR